MNYDTFFDLDDNEDFVKKSIDEIAGKENLLQYLDFIELVENEPKKPSKPTKDEIDYRLRRLNAPVRTPEEARFFSRALEMKIINNNLKKYDEDFKKHKFLKSNFQKNLQGYISYISEESKAILGFFLDKYKTLPLTEKNREMHTHIIGATGSGKSELVKNIFFHYLNRNTSTALVLIDPHGKMAVELAQWPELQNERLVYISFDIEGKTPVFNPFDISDDDRNNPNILSVLVDDSIEILSEILGADFTNNMTTLLRACLTVLFNKNGANFLDVIRFLNKSESADLIEVAEKIFYSDDPIFLFIKNDLYSDALAPTRQAVRMKIINVVNYFMREFLVGESTIKIDDLIKQKKCIIFNFSKSAIGNQASRIMGKFIISHVKALAYKQAHAKKEKTNIHLFIDECQNFLTSSIIEILAEGRKFGLHLTLIQQGFEQLTSEKLRKAIVTNTAIKITGKNSSDNYKEFSKNTGATIEQLEILGNSRGKFCVRSNGFDPLIIKIPSHRIDDQGAVPQEKWAETIENQTRKYYANRRPYRPTEEQKQHETKTKKEQKKEYNIPTDGNDLNIDY